MRSLVESAVEKFALLITHYRHTKAVRLLNELENVVLYRSIIVPLVSILPAPIAYTVAILRGDVRRQFSIHGRDEIAYCLKEVLGDQLGPGERSREVRDFFRLRSCEALDSMRVRGNGRAFAKLVEIRGLEHIEAAMAAGKGAILASAHFGSVFCAFSLLASTGFPITVIANWPYIGSRSFSIRGLYGRILRRIWWHNLPMIDRRPGNFFVAAQCALVLRRNRSVVILVDASDPVFYKTVRINFLNGHALLLPGAVTIAQLTSAQILMMFMRRSADWRHQVLEIYPPIPTEGDTETVFGRCLALVEAAIRQNPAHWIRWNFPYLASIGLLSTSTARGTHEKNARHE